jgi:hypothetical protein
MPYGYTYTEDQDWQDRRQASNEDQFPWLFPDPYERDEDVTDEETNEDLDDE